jgi:geranylgeranyl pyrophosphate synthase
LREELSQLLGAQGAEAEELQQARVRAFAVKLDRTGALAAARKIAERERDAALEALTAVPESSTRELLAHVARALLSRSH